MIKKITFIFLLITSQFSYFNLVAQTKVSNFDFSFQYNLTRGLRGKIITLKQDSSTHIYLSLSAPVDSLAKYKVNYSLISSLDEEIKTVVKIKSLASFFLFEDENGSQFGIKANVGNAKYFVLYLTDTATLVTYPFVKSLVRQPEAEDMILEYENINASIFKPYIGVGSIIRPKSNISGSSIKVDYYDYHFLPAKPPMTQTKDSVMAAFVVDRSLTLTSGDSLNLADEGLYYIHLTNKKVGRSLLVRDKKYPRFGSIDRLVEGLRYLATEEEYLKMTTSFNKKERFDEFWLNNTKSEAKAKRSIREYFKRIKEANILFTNYKEGWKTDMGMIYIIFGPPSKVFLKDEAVMWIYNKSFELPRVAFQFNHINTAFTEDHYILERKAEFQNLWFRTVDLWRSGKKEF